MTANNQKNFDCAAATEHMHEYLDGELEIDLQDAMQCHLQTCPDCATTFAQLRQIESVHQQLDAQLTPPPENYWQNFPQRVIERVKVAERRRLLALPRLPRFKSSPAPSPSLHTPQTGGLLHLPPRVRVFLSGSGKYALAMAAVAAFCFFMIRELRQKPSPLVTTKQGFESEQVQPQAESEVATEQLSPSAVLQAPEIAAEKPAAAAKEEQLSQEVLRKPDKSVAEIEPEPELTSAKHASGGRGAPVASGAGKGVMALGTVSTPHESKALADDMSSSSTEKKSPPATEQTQHAAAPVSAKSEIEEGASLAVAKMRKAKSPVMATPTTEKSFSLAASAERTTISQFSQALWQAQQTSDLKQREKIWRNFLATNPDSAYQTVAIFHLARALAVGSDSTSTPARLETTIKFFRDNAGILRAQMSTPEFEHELTRLESLLNWRKSSPVKKP